MTPAIVLEDSFPVSRVLAVLKKPKRIGSFIVFARHVAESVAKSPYFPKLKSLSVLQTGITALEAAEVLVRTRALGSKEGRDVKRRSVASALDAVRAHVQQVADGDPANARLIIESAGMNVKRSSAPALKSPFNAKQGKVLGSVILVCLAAKGTASYDWQYSTDGRTWHNAASTVQAKTVISGLKPGTRCFFRCRCTTKEGVGDWSQIVSMIVR